MKLSIGIVGLPNVGKSTLFRTLTKLEVTVANYPFATIDPNVGVVAVPDERMEALNKLSSSKKKVPAVVEFYDIAGLVKGASQGEGLGNQFLANIRECKAIVHVVRCFESGEIIHVEGGMDPVRDIGIIEAELALKDLDLVEKRIPKLETEIRSGNKNAAASLEVLKKVRENLVSGKSIFEYSHEPIMEEMQLLSSKHQLFLLNGTESDVTDSIKKAIEPYGGNYVVSDLSKGENIAALISKAYEILGLISFFTTGEDETRAWTIERGDKAPKASGVIHTDFEQKFIRAEVINWQKLLESGGWSQAKQKGWIRLEGKDYVVQDGDVMVIRHG